MTVLDPPQGPTFLHKPNQEGKMEAICLCCYFRFQAFEDESELVRAEAAHQCRNETKGHSFWV